MHCKQICINRCSFLSFVHMTHETLLKMLCTQNSGIQKIYSVSLKAFHSSHLIVCHEKEVRTCLRLVLDLSNSWRSATALRRKMACDVFAEDSKADCATSLMEAISLASSPPCLAAWQRHCRAAVSKQG